MDDSQIIELYFARSQRALGETSKKYGGYCYSIAENILRNRQDAEESVSDTWLSAWNSIPPQRPGSLSVFLGRITRNLSISRWRKNRAAKRGGGAVEVALEELSGCVSGAASLENELIRRETVESIRRFLDTLPMAERSVFLCRYWYLDSAQSIAEQTGFSPAKVRSMLFRTRGKLREHLEKEGLA